MSPRPRPWPRRWRKRMRELLELFVIPLAAALLPYRAALAVLRRLARWRGWYHPEVAPAVEHAHRAGFAPDVGAFARRMRLRLLIEHMDGFLVPLRGRRFLARWVSVAGDPLPDRGPMLLVGTHHGCGYWMIPWLRARKLSPSIIAPQLAPLLVNSSLLENLYVRMRHKLLAMAAGTPMIYRGNAALAMTELLRRGDVGFALCDMPSNRRDAVAVSLAGRPTRLAQNLFEIARDAGAPVFLFASDTDLADGRRVVRFQRLEDGMPIEQQVHAFADLLSGLIDADPTGWRFWSIAPSFFPLPEQPSKVEA